VKTSLRIIVTGLIGQHPILGGITWHYLQYVIGLARLGHDVYYFEDSGEYPYNLHGGASGDDWEVMEPTGNLDNLASIMSRYGFADRWAYRFPLKSEWFGLSDRRRRRIVQSADLLINVSGSLEYPEKYREIPCLVYIDTDPMVSQIKIVAGGGELLERVEMHDSHFSFGESLTEAVPDTGHRWRPTRQPIALSEWRPSTPRGESFTTVMNWTSYAPLVYSGRTYGQKDLEFKRFLKLPLKVAPAELKVALSGTLYHKWKSEDVSLPAGIVELDGAKKTNVTPRDLLDYTGWRVVDAYEACGNLDSYRNYIESSKAEWSVAKNVYVLGQPGWFSERSACYLAAGRPVVVQDTGFAGVLPVGEGILSFRTVQEAAAAIKEVDTNYVQHARAARDIAETYFDSDKVLTHLIDEAMISSDERAVDIAQQNVSIGGTATTIMRQERGDQEQPPRSKKATAIEILRSDLLQHPAVRALAKLRPEHRVPTQIEVLKQKSKGAVYRLVGAGPEQSAIIAKRGRFEKVAIERSVYEEVLPHLPLVTLDYYGFVEEEDGRFCWLFLGDVGDQRYSPFVEEHRVLAGQWLGAMHTAAEGINGQVALRDRGPAFYLDHLQTARETIPEIRTISSLEAGDRVLLKEIVSMCEFLEGSWSQVETFCDRMPRTFIHDDCLAKNVHVQTNQAGLTFAPFDWGGAGWGLPATDLGQLGLPHRGLQPGDTECAAYLSAVQAHWPSISIHIIQQLANLGQMFWSLKVISRSIPEFDDKRTHMETLTSNYRLYASVLAKSIRAARWVN
jgi:hypothetical protein